MDNCPDTQPAPVDLSVVAVSEVTIPIDLPVMLASIAKGIDTAVNFGVVIEPAAMVTFTTPTGVVVTVVV